MSQSSFSANSPPDQSSFRFIDSFLQEQNIKWLLAIGALILLGSSVMLVVSHWGTYTPLWKYLIMFGYTGLIHVAGQWGYHRLGLHKAGTGLMALTVLLLPALFLGLAWVQGETGFTGQMLHWATLALTLVFATLASQRIFNQLLRQPQPTFQICYLLLCLSAAVVPVLPAAATLWAAALLWAIFAIGTLKVNRHVFWLTEQHQLPRIFAFFPIALLGGIFLSLFALHFAQHIALEWLGLVCVLTAIPVLLTADTMAQVFQQRSGGLIEQRPVVIMVPVLIGLIACISAVALATAGVFTGGSGLAVTPTAAMVAVIFALTAQRTSKQALVWAMLVCATLAYNFSPFFFKELALQLLASGAAAVNEEKLPYAFYGLTYLPLIIAAMVASIMSQRRANIGALFSQPLQWFSIAVAGILLIAALTHNKAMFPVSAVMVMVFATQTVLYRRQWLAWLAIAAALLAAYSLAPFAAAVLEFNPWWNKPVFWFACLALLLLVGGYRVDRWLAQLPATARWQQLAICHWVSLGIVLALLPQQWLAPQSALEHGLTAATLSSLLVLFCLRLRQPLLALFTIIFAYASGIDTMIAYHLPVDTIVSVVTLALLAQCLLNYSFRRFTELRISQTFARANNIVAIGGIVGSFILLYLPLNILDLWLISDHHDVVPWLICRILIVVALFDLARRQSAPLLTWFGCLGTLTLTGVLWIDILGTEAFSWLPVFWSALAAITLYSVSRHQQLSLSIVNPLQRFSILVLVLAALASLAVYTLPAWAAGAVATLGLIAGAKQQPQLRRLCLVLINWQIMALAIVTLAPIALLSIADLLTARALSVAPALALISALSAIAWQYYGSGGNTTERLISRLQHWVLTYVCALALLLSWYLPEPSLLQMLFAVSALLVLATTQLVSACQQQQEYRVWLAEALILLAVAALAAHGFIQFGQGWSPFIVLGLGVALLFASQQTQARQALAILSRPLQQTGLVLPGIAVAIVLYRYIDNAAASWLGRNSLVLLMTAGFYFWYGYEQQRRWASLLALAIVNLALALLWQDLAWSDPQFYMIPVGASVLFLRHVLRAQIPPRLHEPLNYLGALIILVSPMFHIATGSWLHIFTLMLTSVVVILLAIGLRIRALMYTGAAFLVADLIAMIVRGSIDNPNLLWLAGLALGAAVFALGAFAERNREQVLQRVRLLSATLADWD